MPGSDRRRLALLLVVMVVLAGCSGAGDGASPDGGDGGRTVGDGDGGSGGGDGAPVVDAADRTVGEPDVGQGQRAIVRTGTVDVRVESFDRASARLERAVREQGGFVAGSSRQVHTRGNATWTSGRLVLRVPSENFSPLFASVNATGDVRRAEVDTDDVTDQLVDLDARLSNLRAERDRLRTLYDRANDTEDVLAVGDRLSDVQGEIERVDARKRSLEERVALSTLTVDLSEPTPDAGERATANWYDVGPVSAFLDSVDGVVVTVRALAVATAYALPYLLVFGTPLAGLGYLVRRRRNRGPSVDGGTGRGPSRSEAGTDGADDETGGDVSVDEEDLSVDEDGSSANAATSAADEPETEHDGRSPGSEEGDSVERGE